MYSTRTSDEASRRTWTPTSITATSRFLTRKDDAEFENSSKVKKLLKCSSRVLSSFFFFLHVFVHFVFHSETSIFGVWRGGGKLVNGNDVILPRGPPQRATVTGLVAPKYVYSPQKGSSTTFRPIVGQRHHHHPCYNLHSEKILHELHMWPKRVNIFLGLF